MTQVRGPRRIPLGLTAHAPATHLVGFAPGLGSTGSHQPRQRFAEASTKQFMLLQPSCIAYTGHDALCYHRHAANIILYQTSPCPSAEDQSVLVNTNGNAKPRATSRQT